MLIKGKLVHVYLHQSITVECTERVCIEWLGDSRHPQLIMVLLLSFLSLLFVLLVLQLRVMAREEEEPQKTLCTYVTRLRINTYLAT